MYKSLGKDLFLALASGVRQIFRFEFKYKKIFLSILNNRFDIVIIK